MRALLLSLAVLLSLPMLAEQVEIDGIRYGLNAETREATLINKSSGNYSGEVVIPESVEHEGTAYSVTSIGGGAFFRCYDLTSVTIGNSVESIGDYAFAECFGLTSVHISDIVAWYNIEFAGSGSNPLSYAHHLYLNGEEVKDLVIPNSVTSIGNYAFLGCSGLTSVTIGNSVKSIGKEAFRDCSGLTSVTIPNSVTSIGWSAFSGCLLQTIVCKAIKPASGNEISSTNMYNHTQLYVPEGTYWDYAFSGWGNFIRIKEMAMDAEDLESKKAYMIADATGRNFSVYDSAKGDLVNIAYTHSLDEESEGTCWTVLKEGNASYLYNIGAKKYGAIAEDGALTLSDAPVGVDIVSTENGLSINGKSCMFVLNNNISLDATGITETENENIKSENSAVYDLSGRRVQKAQKGVFIQNGKVVVK